MSLFTYPLGSAVTPLSGSASPSSLSDSTSSYPTQDFSITVTPSGGLAPYTYAWSITSAFTNGCSATYPSGVASGTVSVTSAAGGGISTSGTIRCRITDSASQTYDVSISVSCTFDTAFRWNASSGVPSGLTYNLTRNTGWQALGGARTWNYENSAGTYTPNDVILYSGGSRVVSLSHTSTSQTATIEFDTTQAAGTYYISVYPYLQDSYGTWAHANSTVNSIQVNLS